MAYFWCCPRRPLGMRHGFCLVCLFAPRGMQKGRAAPLGAIRPKNLPAMNGFSDGELGFVVRSAQSGVRLDARPFDGVRAFSCASNEILQADASVHARLGATEAEISVLFRSTAAALLEMRLVADEREAPADAQLIEIKLANGAAPIGAMPDSDSPALRKLRALLSEARLGLLIEVRVLNDDGNVYDLLFMGLHAIFSDISVPNIRDLATDLRAAISLPVPRSFALVGDAVLADPTLLEEAAADGLVRVFAEDGRALCTVVEGSVQSDRLAELLSMPFADWPLPRPNH